jgi:two-component system, response regulator YesN
MHERRLQFADRPLVSEKSLQISWQAFEYNTRLKKVFSYISEHPDKALSLAEAASAAAMGRTYFSEYFRQNTGVTFKYWIDFLRVKRAIALLRFTSKAILEVAEDCGYQDATTFTRTFRRIEGVTPTQFRRSLKISARGVQTDESPKESEQSPKNSEQSPRQRAFR